MKLFYTYSYLAREDPSREENSKTYFYTFIKITYLLLLFCFAYNFHSEISQRHNNLSRYEKRKKYEKKTLINGYY
jgi:hypothetical protein